MSSCTVDRFEKYCAPIGASICNECNSTAHTLGNALLLIRPRLCPVKWYATPDCAVWMACNINIVSASWGLDNWILPWLETEPLSVDTINCVLCVLQQQARIFLVKYQWDCAWSWCLRDDLIGVVSIRYALLGFLTMLPVISYLLFQWHTRSER